jgi:hypothetical protein
METPPAVGDPGAGWDRAKTWKSRTEVELKQGKSASVVDRDNIGPALVDAASRSEVELKCEWYPPRRTTAFALSAPKAVAVNPILDSQRSYVVHVDRAAPTAGLERIV